eukprot:31222-Pelagococcus_subviridis.AAC.5
MSWLLKIGNEYDGAMATGRREEATEAARRSESVALWFFFPPAQIPRAGRRRTLRSCGGGRARRTASACACACAGVRRRAGSSRAVPCRSL